MRWAAQAHAGQVRSSSDTPYFEHVAAVALILDRVGFPEDVVIAGLLHDVVEDTAASFEDVASRFGETVSELVRHCSEVKNDDQGNKRPWIDRKRDHLAALAEAPAEARAIVLADKLHNLICIELDLREGRPVWSRVPRRARASSLVLPRRDRPLRAGDPRARVTRASCREC